MPWRRWTAGLGRFRGAWTCLFVLAALAAAAELGLSGSVTTESRPTPELDWVAPTLEAAIPTAWFVTALLRVRRDERSSWRRVALVASAAHVVLLLVAFVATTALVVGLGGLKLFGPSFIERSAATGTGRIGYSYTKGLLCGYEIYERRAWTLTLHRVETVSTRGCTGEYPPALVWNGAARRFELVFTNPDERLGEDSFGFTFH